MIVNGIVNQIIVMEVMGWIFDNKGILFFGSVMIVCLIVVWIIVFIIMFYCFCIKKLLWLKDDI